MNNLSWPTVATGLGIIENRSFLGSEISTIGSKVERTDGRVDGRFQLMVGKVPVALEEGSWV